MRTEIKGEYKKRIVKLLGAASQPLDVERIRVGCSIGNWQTALKHCLELLWDEKILGIKTSKSWIFWIGRKCLASKDSSQTSRGAR